MALSQKLVAVDLRDGSISQRLLSEDIVRSYLGGRGVNSYLLYQHLSPEIDPFDRKNCLIVGAGALTGISGVATARLTVSGKSPETGLLGDANIGGHFGAALKKAGVSYLLISGVSPKPVYILVAEGKVSIEDARHLWGKDTFETGELLEKKHGQDAQSLVIGQAGENQVRFACIMHRKKNAAGRCGMGCLMGAKGLKAIVAQEGTGALSASLPEGFQQITRRLYRKLNKEPLVKHFRQYGTAHLFDLIYKGLGTGRVRNGLKATFQENRDISAENLQERYYSGKSPCFSCGVGCKHTYRVEEGPYADVANEGPEFGVMAHFGPLLGIGNLETVLKINDMVNRYGLDASSTANMIACTIELFQEGAIDKETTQGLDLDWGAEEAIMDLIEKIASRQGLGDLLAHGAKELSDLWPGFSDKISWVKHLPQSDPADLRYIKAQALGNAVATRGSDHLRSRPAWEGYGLPEEQLKEIYGGKVSSDHLSYQGKGRVIWWWEAYMALFDALGMCKLLAYHCLPGVFDFETFAELIRCGLGIDLSPQEVFEVGERIITVERLFLAREGVTREDDYPPERYFQPTRFSEEAKETMRDMKLDKQLFDEMLDQYYQLHGWDPVTGIPLPETLERLNLAV